MKLEHAKINAAVSAAHGNYKSAHYWYLKIKQAERKQKYDKR